MIPLFKPSVPVIDLSKHNHLLNGDIVRDFAFEFGQAIGAPYCVPVNSCTNAIELVLRCLCSPACNVPSMIPPVVLNAIIHAGAKYSLDDNPGWVGGPYFLIDTPNVKVVDSAQFFGLNQFRNIIADICVTFMLHSFYPTKPIGGIDGGMISTNSEDAYKWLSAAVMNGTSAGANSWEREVCFPGWKAYMSTAQAIVAMDSLNQWPERSAKIVQIRNWYNREFGLHNISEHLYRVPVRDKTKFMLTTKDAGIMTGVHYAPTHYHPVYASKADPYITDVDRFPKTDEAFSRMVSIPFHYGLSVAEIDKIIEEVKPWILSD